MAGQPGLLRDQLEIEQLDPGLLADRLGGLGRHDPLSRLGPGQRGQHLEPGLQPGALLEDGPDCGRPPQVPVHRRVGDARAHECSSAGADNGAVPASSTAAASPSRNWLNVAPHGTTTVWPSLSMCSSSRQHLMSRTSPGAT